MTINTKFLLMQTGMVTYLTINYGGVPCWIMVDNLHQGNILVFQLSFKYLNQEWILNISNAFSNIY